MAFVNGYPQWMDFAENLIRYRDKLLNLDFIVDETYLFTKFYNALYSCFTTNFGDRKHQDNLYQQMFVDAKHTTWLDIVRLVSANRRSEYVTRQTKAVQEEEQARQAKLSVVYSTKVTAAPDPKSDLGKLEKWKNEAMFPIHNYLHDNSVCRSQFLICSQKMGVHARGARETPR